MTKTSIYCDACGAEIKGNLYKLPPKIHDQDLCQGCIGHIVTAWITGRSFVAPITCICNGTKQYEIDDCDYDHTKKKLVDCQKCGIQ